MMLVLRLAYRLLNVVNALHCIWPCNFPNTTDAAAKRKSFEAEHGLRFLQRGRKTNSVQDLLNAEEIRTAEEEVRTVLSDFLQNFLVNFFNKQLKQLASCSELLLLCTLLFTCGSE
jgi:hypothetical protein